jgi:hypothetical protein
MFKYSVRLFRVLGIEIGLDYSWLIIVALFAFYFGFSYFTGMLPALPVWQYTAWHI